MFAMKLFVLSFLFILQQASFIEGKGFSGYIFNENHDVFVSIGNQAKRYTPTQNDIFLCEKLLKEQIETINDTRYHQSGNCPIIHKKLKKYVRQYVGFVNDKGEKVIWINFIWKDKNYFDRISKDIIVVSDGCSYYWSVQVNLDIRNLHHLRINGQG